MIVRLNKPRNRFRAGLSLVEVMISLSIAAALLTAAAAAFSASAAAVNENDEFFRATQGARVALSRMLTQVRRGSVDEASDSTHLHIITDTGADVTYQYKSTPKQLILITNDDLTDADYVLGDNVTSSSFVIQTGTDYNGATCVARVCIQITVTVGTNKVFLSGSAAPRRNIVF